MREQSVNTAVQKEYAYRKNASRPKEVFIRQQAASSKKKCKLQAASGTRRAKRNSYGGKIVELRSRRKKV